jgi:hypothetical protein
MPNLYSQNSMQVQVKAHLHVIFITAFSLQISSIGPTKQFALQRLKTRDFVLLKRTCKRTFVMKSRAWKPSAMEVAPKRSTLFRSESDPKKILRHRWRTDAVS